tara:strand:+ start:418 stop:1086 length:669 start_codon:yes stop_codon:yes gene_type:complete
MGFDILGYLRDRATEAGGTIQENLGGALRMAGEGLGLARDQVVDYVQDIPAKGAIPIPLTNVIPEARTGAAFVKSALGPVGQPLRILDNPASNEFYQQTIDAADYDPERDVVIFNQDIADQQAYDELGRDFSNKDFGQYVAKVEDDGSVIVDDEFGTNRIPAWHRKRAVTGRDKEGRELGPLARAISAGSAVHRKLEDAGLTNPYPFGAPGSVQIGTYRPRQ